MSNWSETGIADRFGINASYLNGNFSYVFLKIDKVHDHGKIAGSTDHLVLKSVSQLVENLSRGGAWDLIGLVIRTGSHYITSFST